MPKPGKQKKQCEHYKAKGMREINKEKKAQRNQRRIEKFRKRREEGKNYVYKPISDDIKKDPSALREELYERSHKNVDHRLPYQKEVSRERKLNNELEKLAKAAKEAEMKGNK